MTSQTETTDTLATAHDSKVIIDQYQTLATASELPSWMPTYRGLPIHSLPELHERIGALLPDVVPKGASVLDVAAGAGALTLRMQDLGYVVSACDYVADNFRLHGKAAFQRVNLNETFAPQFAERYDCIVTSEILEHIENPRHVLRQCAKMLAPGGVVIITTPNIESSFSIATRLRNGYFSLFDDAYYRRDGHITPIASTTLRQALDEAGFRIEHFETHGGFSPEPWWKMRLLIKLLDLVRTDPDMSRGSSLLVVARLASADPAP